MIPKVKELKEITKATDYIRDNLLGKAAVTRELFSERLDVPIHVIDQAFKRLVLEGRLRANSWKSLFRDGWWPKKWDVIQPDIN